jgi:molybdopterin converting factor small subunit
MPRVNFTSALRRFYPDLGSQNVEGSTISEVLEELENRFPGLTDYLLNEHGQLRKHVNIYIGEQLIEDKQNLEDKVQDSDEILIFQALSGG